MYLYVLLSGQRHASCLWLLHILTKFRPVISDDGLDACLIMNVHNKLLACFGKHCLRPNLKSLLAFEIKLHTSTMWTIHYLMNVMYYQCGAINSYPKVSLDPHRFVGSLHIRKGGVVVKGIGRLLLAGMLNQAREVGLTQKT